MWKVFGRTFACNHGSAFSNPSDDFAKHQILVNYNNYTESKYQVVRRKTTPEDEFLKNHPGAVLKGKNFLGHFEYEVTYKKYEEHKVFNRKQIYAILKNL